MSDQVKQTWEIGPAFDQKASKEAQAEATAFRTVPTGSYHLVPEKAERILTDEQSFFGPGLRLLKVKYNITSLFQIADKSFKSPLFVDYCIDETRDADGKLIAPCNLFLQAQKALEKTDASLGETMEALELYPLNGFLTEVLVFDGEGEGTKSDGSPKNRYENLKGDSDRAKKLAEGQAKGGKPKNYLKNVSKVKS